MPSSLAVRGSGIFQPQAPSPSLSAMARRSLRLGVGAHGWVALLCQSWGHYFHLEGWLPIVEAPGYFRHPTSILARQLLNAFKCNLKEITTKSAWVPRSVVFGMRMPGGWLHRSCDALARSVFPSCWVLSAIFFPSRPPPRLVGFFFTDVFFCVTGACSFPLVWGFMAGLCCCASHGGIISI